MNDISDTGVNVTREPTSFLEILELYKVLKDYAKHEDGLMNFRMTWGLVAATLMLTALGALFPEIIGMNTYGQAGIKVYPLIIASLAAFGVVVAHLSCVGVRAAENGLGELERRWATIAKRYGLQELLPNLLGGRALDNELLEKLTGQKSLQLHSRDDTNTANLFYVLKLLLPMSREARDKIDHSYQGRHYPRVLLWTIGRIWFVIFVISVVLFLGQFVWPNLI